MPAFKEAPAFRRGEHVTSVFVVEFENHDGGREILGRFPSRKAALEAAFDAAEKKCPLDMEPVASDREGPSLVVDFRREDGSFSAVYSEAWHIKVGAV